MPAAIELPVRAISALVMAAVAIFVTIVGGVLFAVSWRLGPLRLCANGTGW